MIMWNVNCYGNAGIWFSMKIMLKGYDATMMVIRYGWHLSSWILRLYSLPVTHIDTQPCILAGLLFIWTSHIIVLLLYRHRPHSLYHIQYPTHQPTQIYHTHNSLTTFSDICGIGSQANRQGNKTHIARTCLLNSKYQTFEISNIDRHNTSYGSNFTSTNYGQFRLRIVSSYGKGWNKYSQL